MFNSPIGQEVYQRTYSRTQTDGSREGWPQTVTRVVAGNCVLAPGAGVEEQARLRALILECALLPAGRHLWATGVHPHLTNCWVTANDPDEPGFTHEFLAARLFEGGGVGRNYSSDLGHPTFPRSRGLDCHFAADGWQVPDTREGWVEALHYVLLAEHDVTFDLSAIRPAGAPLHTFGGTASGPGPLEALLREVNYILNGSVGQPLGPLGGMEIDHAIAKAVVAGGARRSARMSLLNWKDPAIWDFLACKAQDGAHWSTNISVEVDEKFWRQDTDRAQRVFHKVVDGMLANGEPGFYTPGPDGERQCNPCGEQMLEAFDSCVLGHVNLAAYADRPDDELFEAFRLMARFLVRATFAPLEDSRSQEVRNRNRRIGVGILGYHEWVIRRFGLRYSEAHASPVVARLLGDCFQEVQMAANQYTYDLGAVLPITCTTVAPTGTVSLLPGVTSGIQPLFAKRFKRRVLYQTGDPAVAELAAAGHLVEPSTFDPSSVCVEFLCADTMLEHCPEFLVEDAGDLAPEHLFATQAMVQGAYVDNAISMTVNVDGNVGHDELAALLLEYGPYLKGTTVFPEVSRSQAPYERLNEREFTAALNAPLTWGSAEIECKGASCPVR